MNNAEKQILENQLLIMEHLRCGLNLDYMVTEQKKTLALLNPPKQESIAERTHDAFSQSSEVKKEWKQ